MERLIWHITKELSAGYQVRVVGPPGCRVHLPAEVQVDEVPIAPLPLFLLRMVFAALKQALCQRPAVVFAGSGLTAPIAWMVAKIAKARCCVYLHGLDIDTKHILYRLFWRPFIRRCDLIIANSGFTRKLAIEARVSSDRTEILHPGVQLPEWADAAQLSQQFRSKQKLGQAPVILYVGRITARKGLFPFVRDVLPQVVSQCPDARLVVIGDEPVKAILRDDAGERQRCEQSLLANDLRDMVLFLGEINDDQLLRSAYFSANVVVFPVQQRDNDNEGFGMVAIEAAAHGCFTVAYRAGGVSDAVADGVSGKLMVPGDNVGFAQAVISYLSQSETANAKIACRDFAATFEWNKFGQRLRAMLLEKSRK